MRKLATIGIVTRHRGEHLDPALAMSSALQHPHPRFRA